MINKGVKTLTYIKIGDNLYPATFAGRVSDKDWDGRSSKYITLEMTYDEAASIFVDGAEWSIVQEVINEELQYDEEGNVVVDEDGEPVMCEVTSTNEFDNSEFNIAGDIIDHRDGTITVKMGKLTDLEEAYELMLGGVE